MSEIANLREIFQRQICLQAIFLRENDAPSIADTGSSLSRTLAKGLVKHLNYPVSVTSIDGQTAGVNFERLVKEFLESSFRLLNHLRPAEWIYSVHGDIFRFVQYKHLAELQTLIKKSKDIRTALGDYVVKPDVIVARLPLDDKQINKDTEIVAPGHIPKLTPLRKANHPKTPAPILHASISCKLTLRSDRSQNARTEGLNLIRNRKGHTPHIAVVTAEPMPTRIASLALGTGDIDCVYHFALSELVAAARETDNEAVIESLEVMIEGNRLRDIADLPFDLLI